MSNLITSSHFLSYENIILQFSGRSYVMYQCTLLRITRGAWITVSMTHVRPCSIGDLRDAG
jgi:hypothetical protein